MTPDRLILERACAALAALVRQEYPDTYSLAEIAETWGEGVTPEQVDALRVLDAEPRVTLRVWADPTKHRSRRLIPTLRGAGVPGGRAL
jgi:hypothetical protein